MNTRSAKAKGRRFQYFLCEKIAELFNTTFSQSDDNCPIHSREMGQHGTDIILRGELAKLFPYDIECKNCETISLTSWIEQAKANCKKGNNWLLAIKNKKLKKPVVVMDLEAFLELQKKASDS
jgi:hypothetical protein